MTTEADCECTVLISHTPLPLRFPLPPLFYISLLLHWNLLLLRRVYTTCNLFHSGHAARSRSWIMDRLRLQLGTRLLSPLSRLCKLPLSSSTLCTLLLPSLNRISFNCNFSNASKYVGRRFSCCCCCNIIMLTERGGWEEWSGREHAGPLSGQQCEQSEHLPSDGNVIEILQYCNCKRASITVR